MTLPGPERNRLPTGTVPRDQPGARWWRYQRPELDARTSAGDEGVRNDGPTPPLPTTETPAPPPAPQQAPAVPPALPGPPVAPFAIAAILVLGLAVAAGQYFYNGLLARVFVVGFALVAAVGFTRHVQSRHPEEPWIGRFIVWGMIVKIIGTLIRYYVFVVATSRVPDAINYSNYGHEYVLGTARPLPNLRKTNFIFYLTGQIYSLLGPDLIAAFLVFGIAAFAGAYLWYRATASAVPSLNRKMYCALLFFAPSLAFWPSSVGKEAVMLLAMGLAALGTARVLGGSLLKGFAIAAPGGWLLWLVRPHLLVFATVAAGLAYFVGRGSGAKVTSASLKKPIGLAALALLGVLAASQATEALGMKDFSIASIEQELSDTSAQTSQGGSKIDSGSDANSGQVHLTPLSLPQGFVTVLLRPFPWEVESGSQILASVECAFFAWLVIHRRRSVAASLRQLARVVVPFLLLGAAGVLRRRLLIVRQHGIARAAAVARAAGLLRDHFCRTSEVARTIRR